MISAGLGIYTLSDAARLIAADRQKVQRWLFGHSYSRHKDGKVVNKQSAALWNPTYSDSGLAEQVIGFQDLLELRVVHEFVRHGVPLGVVRKCLTAAAEMFGADHPFTRRRFVTDGETIYQDAVRSGTEEGEMLDLKRRQYAFREIIKDALYSGIEYEGSFARRWYPEHRSQTIVIDPELQFGHPVLVESGVPTASVYASYLAENKSKEVVARLFEVPANHVAAAVRFEEKLRLVA